MGRDDLADGVAEQGDRAAHPSAPADRNSATCKGEQGGLGVPGLAEQVGADVAQRDVEVRVQGRANLVVGRREDREPARQLVAHPRRAGCPGR